LSKRGAQLWCADSGDIAIVDVKAWGKAVVPKVLQATHCYGGGGALVGHESGGAACPPRLGWVATLNVLTHASTAAAEVAGVWGNKGDKLWIVFGNFLRLPVGWLRLVGVSTH